MDFKILPTEYHTWGCPVFFLVSPLKGGPTRLPKWKPTARTGVYLGHYLFHDVSVNIINGNISHHHHVVFDNTFHTVRHVRKGTVPKNWKYGRISLRALYPRKFYSRKIVAY